MRLKATLLALVVVAPMAMLISPQSHELGLRHAEAAVSVSLSLDELVSTSTYVVVAKAAEKQSLWEDTPSGRRIVTYTRLDIERSVVGEPGTSVWVRTLGGSVGEIGQWVSGEATLKHGGRALLFLQKFGPSIVVTAMAQGHYPVVTDETGQTRLGSSPDTGMLLPRRGPAIGARDVIGGATLERALTLIEEVRRAQKQRQ